MIVRVSDATRMLCGRYNGMCRGEACMQFRLLDAGQLQGTDGRDSVGYCGLGGWPRVLALYEPKTTGQRGMPEVAPHVLAVHGGMQMDLRAGSIIAPPEASMLNTPPLPCGECAGDDCPGCVGG